MDASLRFGDTYVDLATGQVTRAGRALALEPRTYDVLLHLLRHPNHLVSHGELLQEVWRGTHVTSHSLTQAISQLRQVLEDDPHRPRFIETVHRRGYRWLAPVVVDGVRLGSTRPAGAERWSLPAATTHLIGREELLAELDAALAEGRALTLVGPGGIGKTQLALEAGRRTASSFQHGALLVDCTPEVDGDGVAGALARQLRIDPGERAASLGALAAALRDRNVLLLFDNCERVALPVAALATEVLAACPGVRILATSQRTLAIPGQRVFRVPPLGLPPAGWLPGPDGFGDPWPGSVRLFTERARAVNPDLQVTPDNAAAIAELCRRLDGIPLALELAAARTNVMAPAQLAERLDERLHLLSSPHPEALSRHGALPAMIEWSVSLLAEPARQVLEALSVFSGGWTLEAAQAVSEATSPGSLVDELSSMVDKSLVVVEIDRPQARFRLLDSIHLYLREGLAGSPAQARLRDNHLACFLRFSEEAERETLADPVRWLRRVREEHANLREAFAWAMATPGLAEQGLRLCCNLRWAWRVGGSYVEPREWLVEALAAAPAAPPPLVGKAWIVLGLIHHHRADFEEARAAVRKGLACLPPGERWERAFGAMLLAYIETLDGAPDLAEALAAACEADLEALGDDRLQGFARVRAAVAAGLQAQHEDAVRLLQEAGEHLRRGQEPFLLAFSKVQLGLQEHLAGRPEKAREAALDALRDGCALDNLRMIAGGLEILAYLALEAQDAPRGAHLLGAAARLRELTAAPVLANFSTANRRARAGLEARLGREAFALAFKEGAATPLAEVLEPLL